MHENGEVDMELYSETGTLRATPPFDFLHSLRFLGEFTPTASEQTLEPDSLTKALRVEGQTVVFRVSATAAVDEPGVSYRLFSDRVIAERTHRLVTDRIAFFLSLEDDLEPFYAIGRADPDFAPLIEEMYGYHQVKFLTAFENACWAVLTQRSALPLSRRMKQSLMERFGSSLEVDGVRYEAFPESAELADVDPAELVAVIHNERRAAYLSGAAAAFSGVNEAFLRTAPVAEVEAWLRAIKGIGPWSAEFVLIRGLGRMERLSVAEPRLQEAASHLYGHGRLLTEHEVRRIADRYGQWQGYWAHYLRARA
jgi:DNA-3-methyladenine glycosylase II